MSVDTTARRVAILISREIRVDLDQVVPEAKLATLGADRIDVNSIVVEIEKAFGLSVITDAEVDAITTVAELIAVAEALEHRAAA